MTLQQLLGIDLPILQAPLAGVQGSAMAIAVSNAGGLGALPCAMLSHAQLAAELEAIRRLVGPVLPPVLGDVAALGIDQEVLQDDPGGRVLDDDDGLIAATAHGGLALVARLQQDGFVEGEVDGVVALHRQDGLAVADGIGGPGLAGRCGVGLLGRLGRSQPAGDGDGEITVTTAAASRIVRARPTRAVYRANARFLSSGHRLPS